MKLYVSGPMTGIADFNYPAFHSAKAVLEEHGYDVVSPADLPLKDDWDWIDYIIEDIDSVFEVDGIATLDGCDVSRGARIEQRIGKCRGIPIRPLAEWIDT